VRGACDSVSIIANFKPSKDIRMDRLFGHERLAQQVGEMVAAKVYDRSSSDYRSALLGGFGTTEIGRR
jgi:hypothetical protein